MNKNKKKVWNKIMLLNVVLISTFFLTLFDIMLEKYIFHITTYQVLNLTTWGYEHIINFSCFVFLGAEMIGLMLKKGINLITAAKEIHDLVRRQNKKSGGK